MQHDETGYDELAKVYETYQKNIRNISPEDLQGKYKKAFARLQDELVKATNYFLYHWALDYLYFSDNKTGKEALENSLSIIRKERQRVQEAAFSLEGLEKITELAQEIRGQVVNMVWWPYQMNGLTCQNGVS